MEAAMTLLRMIAFTVIGVSGALAQPSGDAVPEIDPANLPPGIRPPAAITPHTVSAADYPADSIRLQEMGVTTLRYMVLEDGSIGMIEILTPSGFQRLDDASIAMVRSRWRFSPAIRNGQPIRVWQRATIKWQLAPAPLPPSQAP
jgi:protein TonB